MSAHAHYYALTNQKAGACAIGQHVIVRLRGVRNGLQLQRAQITAINGVWWNGEFVVNITGFDGRERGGLHHWIGMLFAQFH